MTHDSDKSVSSPREWALPASSDRVVVIAASAGGLHALSAVLAPLPANFPAAIVVLQHRRAGKRDLLPELLGRQTRLNVCAAHDGDLLKAGNVYICPPGKHIVTEHSLRIVDGPPLDYVRPSANAMMISVARTYGDRAISVILSGNGSDGAAGCMSVASVGGVVIAQDPRSATNPSMPSATAERGGATHVVALEKIAELLNELVSAPAALHGPPSAPSAQRTTPIRVVVADDHRIILDGLRTLLSTETDIDVVGEAEDGETAVRVARELAPDVMVLDIGMPSVDGIEATRRIRAEREATRVVVLTAYVDDARAAQILEAGATGCLSKDAAFSDLATAIRSAAMGKPYFSARVASVFARRRAVLRGSTAPKT